MWLYLRKCYAHSKVFEILEYMMSDTLKRQPLDVLIIGAGFGGVGAAIKLRDNGFDNICIVEKSQAIGGTWYENSYPGAACDVQSHFYCYQFEPNPDWSEKYASQKEILAYINHCADKYDVRQYVRFGLYVRKVVLDEKTGIWQVIFTQSESLYARHIINAMGGLHKPNIPDFKGQEAFAGPTMHSAQWNHAVDFKDKRVALIGSAASAIQIAPELQKTCRKLDIYQRTPNYISPRENRQFSVREKWRFTRWPWLLRMYRWFIYKRMDLLLYPVTRTGSRMGRYVRRQIVRWMQANVKDTEMQARLEPKYALGCKRILISDDFYKALNTDNVELITTPIKQFVHDAIETADGVVHKSDVIVYATGFDLQGHMRSIEMVGTDGISLSDLGLDGEVAFKGAVHSQFPNFYWLTGANTGVGTTSVVYMIEVQITYIIMLLKAAGSDKLISVKPEALEAYNERIQKDLSGSVWLSGCQSWYLRDDGKLVSLYPGSARQFARTHKRLDLENYNVIRIECAL